MFYSHESTCIHAPNISPFVLTKPFQSSQTANMALPQSGTCCPRGPFVSQTNPKQRLIATVGKGNQAKKLTRKAIQEVNVPKACGKIIDPGAPLALRLQGNLLYGVSRVFSQQCGYVLSDCEKIQSDMFTHFRSIHQSVIDPQAGKTK